MRRCSRGPTWSKPAGVSCSRFWTAGLQSSRQISQTTLPVAAAPKPPTSCSPKTAGAAGARSAIIFEGPLALSTPIAGLNGGEERHELDRSHALVVFEATGDHHARPCAATSALPSIASMAGRTLEQFKARARD